MSASNRSRPSSTASDRRKVPTECQRELRTRRAEPTRAERSTRDSGPHTHAPSGSCTCGSRPAAAVCRRPRDPAASVQRLPDDGTRETEHGRFIGVRRWARADQMICAAERLALCAQSGQYERLRQQARETLCSRWSMSDQACAQAPGGAQLRERSVAGVYQGSPFMSMTPTGHCAESSSMIIGSSGDRYVPPSDCRQRRDSGRCRQPRAV